MSYHPYVFNTWTPVLTLTGGGGNTVPVYTVNSGTYTRLGRAVFFNIELSGDGGAEGAGTGQITITLPFTTAASQLPITEPWGSAMNSTNEHVLFCRLAASSATMLIFKDNVSGSDLDYVVATGADQSDPVRSIQISGKILVQ